MAGVKAGRIGYLPKQGLKPQAFFHLNSKSKAISQRNTIAFESIQAIAKITG